MATSQPKTRTLLGLVLVAAATVSGAWWLLRQSSDQLLDGGSPGPANQALLEGGNSPAGPDLVPAGAGTDPIGPAETSSGREKAPPQDPKSRTMTLTAVDAITGEPVPRFSAQRSGAGELGRDAHHFRTALGETTLTIPIADPPGLFMVRGSQYAPKEIRPDGPGFRRVELARATAIVGTVRDAASAAVPAARVTLELQIADPETGAATWGPPKGASLRRTDQDGRYAFANLPPGIYRTSALAGTVRHVSEGQSVTAGDWTTIDHWLSEDGSLSVELVRPDGSPSSKSRIMLGGGEAQNGEPILARYTDNNGRAILGPLEAGTYELTVLSDHGTLAPVSITLPLEGAAQNGLRLELQSLPGGD